MTYLQPFFVTGKDAPTGGAFADFGTGTENKTSQDVFCEPNEDKTTKDCWCKPSKIMRYTLKKDDLFVLDAIGLARKAMIVILLGN